MSKKFSAPRGTADILPSEVRLWTDLESAARTIFSHYNYKEIRTCVFEDRELFKRSLGQTSDVVNKQLLELRSQKEGDETGETYALRPEGTASIVRSYVENDFDKRESISKFFYIGAMFRGERPQKGRLRQFHQIGAEAIGPSTLNPYLDAEMISLSVRLLDAFGISGYHIKINNLGDVTDKENFSKYLREKLGSVLTSLCKDCQDRFERNVFRVLDCKNKQCIEVVDRLKLNDSALSSASKDYFNKVKKALDSLHIKYEQSLKLVRGLDYYNYTVFEILHSGLGSQDAIGAGGRYNHLVAQLGGEDKNEIGAIGFSLGMERILLVKKDDSDKKNEVDIFMIALDEESFRHAFLLLNELRAAGLEADIDYKMGSLKSQMRTADKYGARFVVIIGEDELKKDVLILKNMKTAQQQELSLKDTKKLIQHIRS